jgi:NAD+ synthase
MRELDIPGTIERITAFLKSTMRETGFDRVVVAVSGGIDSTTAIALATAALAPEQVFALSMPYRDWHTEAAERAERFLGQLQIPSSQAREIDIAPMVEAFQGSVDLLSHPHLVETRTASEDLDTIRLGNIMARVRMVVLFDQAKKLGALVLGTENKSEHYLGYYTRFGDEASDIEPLRNLYKTEVYHLAEHLGVPQEIRAAVPTAGLWPGQSDEGQFGFTYEAADEILYGLYEAKRSPQDLIERGVDQKAIEQVQAWVAQMAFKHDLPRMAPEPVLK